MSDEKSIIIKKLEEKSGLKYQVHMNTIDTFKMLKKIAEEITKKTAIDIANVNKNIKVEFFDKSDFEFQIKFAGDLLVVTMHTNVFEFPRDHEIMKTSYIKDNPTRSFCGIISMYNFLADSFKYNRINDIGYLVARLFVNNEKHYFVEGKRQMGLLFNNFTSETIDDVNLTKIIETAMVYCIDFDLLTPPYDNVKEVPVSEMIESTNNMMLKTGKRLGFRFQIDKDDVTRMEF